MGKGERTITQLEWFAITYRTVVTYSAIFVILVVGGLSYWYWSQHYAPREAAAASILQAENKYKDAAPFIDAQSVRETLARALAALGEARTAFAAAKYADARFAALHSTDLSLQALQVAKGNAADARKLL